MNKNFLILIFLCIVFSNLHIKTSIAKPGKFQIILNYIKNNKKKSFTAAYSTYFITAMLYDSYKNYKALKKMHKSEDRYYHNRYDKPTYLRALMHELYDRVNFVGITALSLIFPSKRILQKLFYPDYRDIHQWAFQKEKTNLPD